MGFTAPAKVTVTGPAVTVMRDALPSLLALAFLAAPAACGPAAEPAAAPAAGTVASARAQADRILQQAGAAEVFENITTTPAPTLRHRRSGMTCVFNPHGPRNNVAIYDQGAGIPRGDDVGCGTNFGLAINMYATRCPRPTIVEEQMLAALQDVRRSMQDVRPFTPTGAGSGSAAAAGETRLPPRRTVSLLATDRGRPVMTRTSVALYDGWVIKQRLTALAADAEAADQFGERLMIDTLTRMAEVRTAGAGGPSAQTPATGLAAVARRSPPRPPRHPRPCA